jgi:hypothetical protein
MFFVERGSQIISLVNAVVDSVSAIADGAIGVAASAVENALSKALPVVISFLAALLGVTGITEKIRAVIAKVQAPVHKAIDWLINKAVGLVKAAGKFLGFGKDKKDKEKGEDSDEKKHADLAKQAVLELQKVGGETKDYKALRTEKETQAKQIEQSYATKLKQGIKLRVNFEEATTDEKDKTLNFKIVIAPNTTVVLGGVNLGSPQPPLYPTGEDPRTRTITQLWKDCSEKTTLIGESGDKKQQRMQLAEQALITKLSNSAMVQAILAHDRGQSPRKFTSVLAEDNLGLGGHTTQRHVFGMGIVSNVEKLAIRVCRHQPAPCPNKAGAFGSLADANISVQNALNSVIDAPVWPDIRQKIVTGAAVPIYHSLSSRGTALVGNKILAINLPPYLGGTGNRPLYPGDSRMPSPGNPTPLTTFVECNQTFVRVVAKSGAPGGWYVNSAWPE